MKCTKPEISWHNRNPILSIDIHPSEKDEFYRLASGGCDSHVLIWHLRTQPNGAVNQKVVSDLDRHQKPINVVRWSPSGLFLASGDGDATIIIWTLKTDNIPLLEDVISDKEIWIVHKILHGHKEDVYDICWSPNGLKLISGSIDTTAIIWDFAKGINECILSDHGGFVQGVVWDPKGQYLATLSSDRICRVFDSSGKCVIARIHKGLLPLPESHLLYNKEVKYFHGDTFTPYFRRLTCSPDGNLLIVPSGCMEHAGYTTTRHTSLIFAFDNLIQPVAVLPSPKQITVAVRCCPVLFELRSSGMAPIIALPYRMVIAVATETDVILYDTQQPIPFAYCQKICYGTITDLTWSPDGLLLIASSTAGYCSLVTFEPGELGVQYIKEDSEEEASDLDVNSCEKLDKNDSVNLKTRENKQTGDIKIKKPNILEKWVIRKAKGDLLDDNAKDNKTGVDIDIKPSGSQIKNRRSIKIPKRIAPIKIGKNQDNKNNSKLNTVRVPKLAKNKPKNEQKEDTVKSKLGNCNLEQNTMEISFNADADDLASSKMEESKQKTQAVSHPKDSIENPDIKSQNVENETEDIKIKKPNILEKWVIRKAKGDLLNDNAKDNKTGVDIDIKPSGSQIKNRRSIKIPKRIAPIKIGKNQDNKNNSKLNTVRVPKLAKNKPKNEQKEDTVKSKLGNCNLEQNTMEISFNADTDDLASSKMEESKQKTQAVSHPKDSIENPDIKSQNVENENRNETEDVASSSNKQDSINDTQQSNSTTVPTKTKVPRRVQLITLSRPKQRKNIIQRSNNE